MTLRYDSVGNLHDGDGKAYEWDAANRLVAINSGSNRSEFTYDGLSRRVKIVEKTGGTVTSTKQFVWVGNTIAQERDEDNKITRQYFAEGEKRETNYYYTRDHLGSIREMVNSSGVVEARYDYDPYGQRTKLSGALDVDFGYTGHYHHAPSGLNLTLYRAYNPALGRWLSRDPIGEAGGVNLYRYAINDPTTFIDPDGKSPVVWAIVIVTVGVTIYHVYHLWHPAKEAGKDYGDYVQGCISIMKDPDNGGQHAREAADAINRLGPHLNELGARAGATAVTGPLEGPLEIPIP